MGVLGITSGCTEPLASRMFCNTKDRDVSRDLIIAPTWGSTGLWARAPLFETETSFLGERHHLGNILGLTSSFGCSRFPSTVAGLGTACTLLAFASDDFGRPYAVGGLMPGPTLCEKEEFEVVREAFDVLRDIDEEEEDGPRATV